MYDDKWDKLFHSKPKSISINNYCDEVFVINLKHRSDRLASITSQCESYDIVFSHFNAVNGNLYNYNYKNITNGQIGCLSSHIDIIRYAQAKKYKKILILEDDVIFKENIIDFHKYIHILPTNWDMFYLTGNNFFGLKQINSLIFKTAGTLNTAAYMIKNTIFQQIIDIADKQLEHPIDTYYAKMHTKIEAYVAVPSLCYQMAGFSDIEKRHVNYDFMK